MDVPRTLIVTNDFPPRVGGVQQYVWNVASNLPEDRVAVVLELDHQPHTGTSPS